MKAIKYPTNPEERCSLKQRYVTALESLRNSNGTSKLRRAQKDWKKIRRHLPRGSRFPSDIRKILRAEYPKLVAYYTYYVNMQPIDSLYLEKLHKIFSYETYHDAIAGFFMDDKNGFILSVCHYCGAAYINKYTVKKDDTKGLSKINNVASVDELKKLLKINNIDNLQLIYDNIPYDTIEEFNTIVKFHCRDKFHSVFPKQVKNHFDLDHVLDKGNCPITALSLMNFVPSCSVCNEKLKKSKVLGRDGKPIEELSPTSKNFDFDNQVTFWLIPEAGAKLDKRPTANQHDYELMMSVDNPDYDIFIEMFHLRERYCFHKMEALFWLELKLRYPDSRIEMMANSLNDPSYSAQRIKDDIFQRVLDQRERCFEKLKRDILK